MKFLGGKTASARPDFYQTGATKNTAQEKVNPTAGAVKKTISVPWDVSVVYAKKYAVTKYVKNTNYVMVYLMHRCRLPNVLSSANHRKVTIVYGKTMMSTMSSAGTITRTGNPCKS